MYEIDKESWPHTKDESIQNHEHVRAPTWVLYQKSQKKKI